MSEKQKSSKAGLIAIAAFLLIVSVFVIWNKRQEVKKEGSIAREAITIDEAPKSDLSRNDKGKVAAALESALSPGAQVEAARDFYTPKRTAATKPNRTGRIPSVTGPADRDFNARELALEFLQSGSGKSPISEGWAELDLADPIVLSEAQSKKSGITALHLRQNVGGIEVYNSDLNINIAKDGSILSMHNGFVKNIAAGIQSSEPKITANQAIAKAAGHALVSFDRNESLDLIKEPEGIANESIYDGGDLSQDPIPAKLVYVAQETGETKLAWNLVLHLKDGTRWLDMTVDADNGDLLTQANWYANADYRVFAQPKEHPNDGARTLESDPHDLNASPFGWHDTNGVAGAETTDTSGNNVEAQEDTDNTNGGGRRVDGGAGLVFDNPMNLATQAPAAYESAAITNLFYWNNMIHDILWHHGFDESSGNFQAHNYGNGGIAGDPVQADAQDGSGTNNANFGTPPDGQDPRMQMYVWTQADPDRDSDLDSGIIIHEYGHGVSNRLTGGAANSSALSLSQSRGMGEGWSDWLGLSLTAVASDTSTTPRGIGTYVLDQSVTGAGIRPFRYSTDLAENPQTYGNLASGTLSVPHGVGSVWCTSLWEMYWALVGVHGWDADLYNGGGGNNLAIDLVLEGMKLQPANPSFLDARDAIILADQTMNAGANLDTIWVAFAKRGMGYSADDGGSASSLSVTEAFDLPDEAISITDVTVIEGNSGTVTANFTVSLDLVAEEEIRVNWQTEDISAFAGQGDFASDSGQLIFAIGDTVETITVQVAGDTTAEDDETFGIRLSNPVDAFIVDDLGVGTISNDDYITPVITSSLTAGGIESRGFSYTITGLNTPRTFSISNAPAGMTVNSATGEISWTPDVIGVFNVNITASNPVGSDTETLVVSVEQNDLLTALDVSEIPIAISAKPWALQTVVTHDGIDAAQSGDINDNETSWMELDISGPETILFQWKVSSESGYDFLQFKVNGTTQAEIDGEVDWTRVSYDLPEGDHKVRWEYSKDSSVSSGADAGWVDELILLTSDPRPFITSAPSVVGKKSEAFEYQIRTSNPATSYASGALPPGLSLNGSTGLISGTPTIGGVTDVPISASNASGTTEILLQISIIEVAILPFSETFESGTLQPVWVSTGTSTYRTEVTQANVPNSGSWHLTMDSSTNSSPSRNELTMFVDVAGDYDLELRFFAKDFGDESDGPPEIPYTGGADYDGVSISPDGVNWYEVQPLRSEITGTYSQFVVDIDAAIVAHDMQVSGIMGIRFNHFDNFGISTDGFAIDDIYITGEAGVVSPPQLAPASDIGTSNTDGITADFTPTFFGTGSPGAAVSLTSHLQGVIKTGLVEANGTWTMTSKVLTNGPHSVSASISGGEDSVPLEIDIDSIRPTLTLEKEAGQADPSESGEAVFKAVFSEDVVGFGPDDVVKIGAAAGDATVTGGPLSYTVTVDANSVDGRILLNVPFGAARDIGGNNSDAASSTDNLFVFDGHGDSKAEATSVSVASGSASDSGFLDSGDIDVFTFTLNGPRLVQIHTTGSVDTLGELRDSADELINDPTAEDNQGTGDNFLLTKPLAAGTYSLSVSTNNGEEGDYALFIDAATTPVIQPDVIVSGLGDDLYNTLGGQILNLISKKARAVKGTVVVENDGELTDTFSISASPGTSIFRVSYTSVVDGNVTAALTAGTLSSGSLQSGVGDYRILATIRPNKGKVRKRVRRGRRKIWKYKKKFYATTISATSGITSTRKDAGSIWVRTK